MNFANSASLKAFAAKATLALTAAAAFIFAVPTQSQAQAFAVVRTGPPAIARPEFARPGFDRREDLRRREQFERRQAFLRHQEWERAHRFGGFYR
jgi:hypothetical protein